MMRSADIAQIILIAYAAGLAIYGLWVARKLDRLNKRIAAHDAGRPSQAAE